MDQVREFDIESRTEITGVLDIIDAPAVALSLDYRILAANRAYREAYGDGQPLYDRTCYEVSHKIDVPCDRAGESCPLAHCISTGAAKRVLHLHQTTRGEEHVDVETHPVRDQDGEIAYVVEILRETRTASSRTDAFRMVGRSAPFTRMLNLLNRVAPAETAVLLQGESGTGKELVARAIHDGSARGAFTGAYARKVVLVESADRGTLFLDEIGDVPLSLQVKLLRLLETGTYRRVGSVEPRQSNFRLITATHRDLNAMVGEGRFRRDLFYRISTFPIPLPALRERADDIPLLADSLLRRLSPARRVTLADETLALLRAYRFPGNIRELLNLLERALLLADGDEILPRHLPAVICDESPLPVAAAMASNDAILPLDEVERRYLQAAVSGFAGDRDELAEKLGISRRTLYRKLEKIDR